MYYQLCNYTHHNISYSSIMTMIMTIYIYNILCLITVYNIIYKYDDIIKKHAVVSSDRTIKKYNVFHEQMQKI